MKKQFNARLFVVLACLGISLLYCPPVDIFYDDKSIFKYFGFLLSRGATPYQSFFDHKPPLIFFLHYASSLLGPWGLWMIDTALVLTASMVFYDTCKRYRLPLPWLLPLLFNLLLRDYRVSLGIGMTREYTAIIQLIFFCSLLSEHRFKYPWLGILTGLTFFMQQEQILLLLPFFAYDAWNSSFRRLPRQILEVLGGFALSATPILIWFAARHALGDLWKDAFLFNFNWYTAERSSFMDHFRTLHNALENTGLLMVFLTVTTLAVAAIFLRNRRKALVLTALVGLGLSLSQEFLSGKLRDLNNFAYYLEPLAASIPILAFTVFAFTEEDFFRNKINQLIYGTLLCLNISYDMLQHATHLSTHNEAFLDENPGYRYLQQHPPGDNQLYILGDANFIQLYNRFRILCPSPWVYQHFWNFYPNWDRSQQVLHAIQQDLLSHHTTYVLDRTPPDYFRNPGDYQTWLSFLTENYQPVVVQSAADKTTENPTATQPQPASPRVILWKIKDALQ